METTANLFIVYLLSIVSIRYCIDKCEPVQFVVGGPFIY